MNRILFTTIGAPTIAREVLLHVAVPDNVPKLVAHSSPSVLLVEKCKISEDLDVGTVAESDIVAYVEGVGDHTILVTVGSSSKVSMSPSTDVGDAKFIAEAMSASDDLGALANSFIAEIRAIDPSGTLIKTDGGRWVNDPINFVAVKVQPRKGDLAFTIYGNPDKFADQDFIKQDQNSYSRGWVASQADLERLIALAKVSFALRTN